MRAQTRCRIFVCWLAAGLASVALAQGRAPQPLTAVAGFTCEGCDERDLWTASAIEETLAWRLRRTPTVLVAPTVRVRQACEELRESPADALDWRRAVAALGVRRTLTGVCSGTPDALSCALTLTSDGKPVTATVGPGRLFEVIDQATRWALPQLGVERLDAETERLLFARPSESPSTLEYYVRSIAAGREQKLRDAYFYVQQATDYDALYLPAQLLLAQLEMRGGAQERASAAARLRYLREIARKHGDKLAVAEIEAADGTLALLNGTYEGALQRFTTTLELMTALSDTYGRLMAITSLCDANLALAAPKPGADADASGSVERLAEAGRCMAQAIEIMRDLGDRVAEAPACNRLALIKERLKDDDAAMALHQRTLELATELNSRRAAATAWMCIGQLRQRRDQPKEAVAAFEKCVELADNEAKPAARYALAEAYRKAGQLAEALPVFQAALKEMEQTPDLSSQLQCLRSIADTQKALGQRDAALATLAQAIDVAHALEAPVEADLKKLREEWKK